MDHRERNEEIKKYLRIQSRLVKDLTAKFPSYRDKITCCLLVFDRLVLGYERDR
jgi:hypothetical protein